MLQIGTILRTLRTIFAAMIALSIAVPAWAQTTGAIRGTVTDYEMGLPIPNVEVTISSDNLIGGAQSRPTDANGGFQFVELPPGTYRLQAEKAGFQSMSVVGITVNIGRTTVQNLEMPVGGEAEEVEVVGSKQAVDVEDTTRGQVLTKDFLQRIPTGRSYQSAVTLAAGVTGGGGNPNMAGASYNENTYMLDGANITDPVTGTFSVNFNYDAIQQIEVLLGGYEPEYGVSVGGVINLVTDSGTNNLEFDTAIFYNNGDWRPRMDARFTADGFILGPTGFDAKYQSLQVSAKVAGPVVRDRAWFIISYQHSRTLIANTGIPQERDYDGPYVLAKLTLQPNSEHRITSFIQLDPTTIDNVDQGDPFQKAESQGRQTQGGYVTQGRWQWFLSPDANVDTQVVVQKTFIEVNAVPCTHNYNLDYHRCRPFEAEGDVDWETPGRIGLYGAYNSVNYGYFYFDDRLRYQASSKLSLLNLKDPLGGSHDMKFGVEANQTVWDQIQGYAGSTLYYDLNTVGYDPETFENFYWFEITGPIKFRADGMQWSAFAQDAWKPVSNLTVKYGTRFDSITMHNDLSEPVLKGAIFGPRFFASWDPFGDQKTKVASGWGRFNDTGRLAVADFTSASTYGSKLYVGEFFADTEGLGFVPTNSGMAQYDPYANRNKAHPNLRLPRVDEVILLLEREVIQDLAVRVNMSGKFTRNMYEFDELNVMYDEDGSSIIGSRQSDPLINLYRLRTPTLAKRDYYQADFVLNKIESRRWSAQVTYTYTASIGSSSTAQSGSFANDPQSQFNYGPLATDLRHVVKGWAFWNLPTDPWDQNIGMTVEYYSGQPLERRYFSDNFGQYSLRIKPRGFYHRFNPIWNLSLQFSQDIDVRKGAISLTAIAENLLNNRAPSSLSAAFYSENRLFAVSRQDPLRLTLGVRYTF